MKTFMKAAWKWLALLWIPAVLGAQPIEPGGGRAEGDPPVAATGFAHDADQILEDTGFQGGLIVVVGCDDAELLVALAGELAPPDPSADDSPLEPPTPGPRSTRHASLVHGLVRDPARLESVRSAVCRHGSYGQVSVMAWRGPHLPYADGMVNLLLVMGEPSAVTAEEIERVLVPSGVAWSGQGEQVTMFRKDWPADVDHWTHSRYDAAGNAVSDDRQVGPPEFLQWEAGPRWNRSVKTSALVSTGGRIFTILDDSHFASETRTWSLIARDAFNGIQLWRHELDSWGGARGGKKVGPVQMHRRLVACGDVVYVTLGESAPVSMLDAATGEPIRTFEATQPTEEFLLSGGVLVALIPSHTAAEIRRGSQQKMQLVAADPETGQRLWTHDAAMVLPMTLAADGNQVVYHDGRAIRSLDLQTGVPRWTSPPTGQKVVFRDQAHADSPGAEPSTIILAPQFAPTLIMYQDVVAFAGGRQLNVVSADDGRELWRSQYAASNYSVPVDLFGFRGLLWGPDKNMNLWRPLDDDLDFIAFDPRSGDIRETVRGKYGFRFQHHRCHQMKVVGDKVIAARAGIEFLDTHTGEVAAHHWTRGSCYFGVLPANGLLYVPPHDCACYVRAKLAGFLAMRSQPPAREARIPDQQRLQRGPAFGDAPSEFDPAHLEDWPTYRRDVARSGRVPTKVATDLLLGWQAPVGGSLTSPVVAGNRVFVASTDQHTLSAWDARTGQLGWQYRFDARVDSPPTIHEGLVLCGCRDGSVHALRADDGRLVWRFQASPEDRMIVARGQLESAWPVSGSVLVVDNTVYFTAGRSSYLDGGIRLYGLEPRTGRKTVDTLISTRHPDGSQRLDDQGVDGCLNDILSSDGQRIFLRHQAFDPAGNALAEHFVHLHGADGFLSADTTARLLWTYAPRYTSLHQGAFYDLRLSRMLFPSGRILVEGDEVIYGFGQNHYGQPRAETGGQYALFAADKFSGVPLDLSAVEYRKLALAEEHAVDFRWWTRLPIQVWAMLRTDDLLFVAGPVSEGAVPPEAFEGRWDALLLAVCPAEGKVLAEMPLPAAPVWDGMAAARGNLVLSLTDGQILCLWSAASGRPGTPLTPGAWRALLPEVRIAEEPGLIGRWRFDEGIGRLARDSSGQGHDAIVSGRWATGDFGTCLIARAAPRSAVIPDAEHLHFGNDDFTLAMWVKVDGPDVRLIGKEAFPENWWVINVLGDGRAELVLGEGRGAGRSVRASTAAPLALGDWNHLAAVIDRQRKEVRWYRNGQADSSHPIPETMTEGIHAKGRDLAIPSTHKPFDGLIGDLRIYRQAQTAERIRQLYHEDADRYTSTDFQVLD
jgi:outer membrane protein assembly factor BamB